MSGPTLVARAGRLGAAYDLLAAYEPPRAASDAFFFERSGLGLAGSSDIAVGPWTGSDRFARAASQVGDILSEIRLQDGGPGPVVAGAFPFVDREPATLHLLTRAVVRRELGQVSSLEVRERASAGAAFASDSDSTGPRRPRAVPAEAFEEGRLRPDPNPGAYLRAVEDLAGRIRSSELRKVVLARTLLLDAGRELDPRALLLRLRAVDPGCFAFAVSTAAGVLVGASPELLVARSGLDVRANPLAGSAPRFGDPVADRASGRTLLSSGKDREEHEIVAEAVEESLAPFCERLDRDPEPVLLGTANVWHLSTRFDGTLREPAASVLELVGALHPTPAVCGSPREPALAAISEFESFDRGSYAGPIGWVDASGDGEWAIALRCAELRGTEARMFAGAGIVADSQPERELDETERKFRALLDALRWG
jgi:isochorismate synthase